jgi:hypothetical protein
MEHPNEREAGIQRSARPWCRRLRACHWIQIDHSSVSFRRRRDGPGERAHFPGTFVHDDVSIGHAYEQLVTRGFPLSRCRLHQRDNRPYTQDQMVSSEGQDQNNCCPTRATFTVSSAMRVLQAACLIDHPMTTRQAFDRRCRS